MVAKVHCEGRVEGADDFVFNTAMGTRLDGRNVTKRFQRIVKHAKIPAHRFHDLRDTAATLLAIQGVHPKAIQSVLGWDPYTPRLARAVNLILVYWTVMIRTRHTWIGTVPF